MADDSREELVRVRRALISVSDKAGLAEFARALVGEFGVEVISTGGWRLGVREVGGGVGGGERGGGGVQTLHREVDGGLLALRDDAGHMAAAAEHGIGMIDLICINLYPFEETVARAGVTFEEAIENIDIGGPSMVRSAAKNHRFVLVVTEPSRYEKVMG